MVNQNDVLRKYAKDLGVLKKQCLDAGINEDEFQKLYFESINSLERSNRLQSFFLRYVVKYKMLIITFLAAVFIISNYKLMHGNIQEYIYPGLRILRRFSIPFISLFPTLTEYYHETCLIQNPFFTVVDMDCWPCSTINDIRDVHELDSNEHPQNAPFIYQTQQAVINKDSLKEFYTKNKEVLDQESPKVLCNNKYYVSPEDMFQRQETEEKSFYIWKFNNMNTARLLRQIIPRPKVVPKFGQSTERFIIVDSSQNQFRIPDTECNFSFLLSLTGSRIIELIPAEECKNQCKSLRVELKDTYLLWYNWWYWRPVVQQSLGNDTFIANVGSYC